MCPKVSFYAVKSFDRVLGGLALSVAGGAGLYTIHSWLSSIRIMNNVSEYTFSGRTSCMRRKSSEAECDCGIRVEKLPIDCMAKIATIVDHHDATLDDMNSCDGPDTACDLHCDDESRYRAGSDPLMDLLLCEECEDGEGGGSFMRGCASDHKRQRGDSKTSPTPAFNLLTCLYCDSMYFGSSPIPSLPSHPHGSDSDDGEGKQEQEQEEQGDAPPQLSSSSSSSSSREVSHNPVSDTTIAGNELSLYSQLKQYLHKYLLLDAQ
mmetsp:Transcript_11274/g.18352  ORF Transcript_11274/g.18352 Transcript_11274/m.18352 type:complete len:264 (+) Transcript_11274:49-840(+)